LECDVYDCVPAGPGNECISQGKISVLENICGSLGGGLQKCFNDSLTCSPTAYAGGDCTDLDGTPVGYNTIGKCTQEEVNTPDGKCYDAGPPTCYGYRCKDNDPANCAGDNACTETLLTENGGGDFDDCYTAICESQGGICQTADSQGQSWIIFKDNQDCLDSPSCKEYTPCSFYKCDELCPPATTDSLDIFTDNCCQIVTVESDPNKTGYDANCDCDGTYNGLDGYDTKNECVINCSVDNPWYTCAGSVPTGDECIQETCTGVSIDCNDPENSGDCDYNLTGALGGSTEKPCHETSDKCEIGNLGSYDLTATPCQCPVYTICNADDPDGTVVGDCVVCLSQDPFAEPCYYPEGEVTWSDAGGASKTHINDARCPVRAGVNGEASYICNNMNWQRVLNDGTPLTDQCADGQAACNDARCGGEFNEFPCWVCPTKPDTEKNCVRFDANTGDALCMSENEVCPTGCYATNDECKRADLTDRCFFKPCYYCPGEPNCDGIGTACLKGNKRAYCQDSIYDFTLEDLNACNQACCGESPGGNITGEGDGQVGPQGIAEGNHLGFSNKQLRDLYGLGGVGGVLVPEISNEKKTSPVVFSRVTRGELPKSLFRVSVHTAIKAVYYMNKGLLPYSDLPYNSIRDLAIENSIHSEIVTKMKLCRAADGRPLHRTFINTIREHIVLGTIDDFDVPAFVRMLDNIIAAQKTGRYDTTRGKLDFKTGGEEQKNRAIDLVMQTAKPYDHRNYGERWGEKMRLWKTVATDLFKNIPFFKEDGTESKIPIKKDDSFAFFTEDDTEVKGYINDGDYVTFVNEEGKTTRVEVDGHHARAGVIDLEVMQKALYLLGDELEYEITITTPEETRVEELYNTEDSMRRSYLLKLQPSSIVDLPRKNQFVSRTQSEYIFETGRKKHNDWVKYKPWPYLVVYVHHDDPIIQYIGNSSKIELRSKDFTLDTIDNGTLPLYPRRLPWSIVIIPTDRTDLLGNTIRSQYLSYGVRRLIAKIHPDPERSKGWNNIPHLKSAAAADEKGVAPTRNLQALEYSYDFSKIAASKRYNTDDGKEPLPRRKSAVRRVLETLYSINAYYEVDDESRITWGEVYKSIPRSDLKFLYRECLDWINIKTKLSMGSASDNESVDTLYARPLDRKSNNEKLEDFRIFETLRVGVQVDVSKLEDGEIPPSPDEIGQVGDD
jgi:hypothetical protein